MVIKWRSTILINTIYKSIIFGNSLGINLTFLFPFILNEDFQNFKNILLEGFWSTNFKPNLFEWTLTSLLLEALSGKHVD